MNRKHNKLLILLICIILILFALVLFTSLKLLTNKNNVNKPIANIGLSTNQTNAENPDLSSTSEQEYFELQGFGQLEINETNRNINLINPKGNKVYLSYKVLDGDNVLYETELIEPGKMIQFDIYSCLNAGEHTITYSIDVYDISTKVMLWSGIKQEQDLLIK